MLTPSEFGYLFDGFYMDVTKRVLLRDGDPIPLTPKAFDTLLALVRRSTCVVRKEELLSEVWPNTFVEEATLAQNIFTLRKALGQGSKDRQYIETIPKHGYRFIAEVSESRRDQAAVLVERQIRTHIITEEVEEGLPSQEKSEVPRGREAIVVGSNGKGAVTSTSTFAATAPRAVALSRFPALVKRHRKTVALVLVLPLIGAAFLFIRSYYLTNSRTGLITPFQKVQITKLTTTGKVNRAAISPDGKYVAYVQDDGSQESLWLRQTTAINSLQVVAPAPVRNLGLVFSPDSSALYFVQYEKDAHVGALYVGALYKIPVLGGVPRRIISDIDSNIALAPDEKRFAFLRYNPNSGAADLIVANVDGSAEEVFAGHSSAGFLTGDGPAWSPDGKIIVCPLRTGQTNHRNITLAAIDTETRTLKTITSHQWESIGQVEWLMDGSGLVLTAWDESVSALSRQIWETSYPSGESRVLVNDLNRYLGLSITADAKALVTVLSDRVANFWVAPSGEINKATQISAGLGDKYGEKMEVAWTTDHRILFGSTADDKISVWIMNADGSNQKQITTDPSINFRPVALPGGHSFIFVSRRTGSPHLWRMDLDGGNTKQLTDGNSESFPDVSPDGQWIVYTSIDDGTPTVWKMKVDGGAPIRLADQFASNPRVSPDGKLVACYYRENPDATLKIAIIPLGGGPPIKTFNPNATIFVEGGVRWAPDGRALTFIDNQDGISNIWSQPLDGGPPKRLTDFTSGQIFRFAWAPDGKGVVLSVDLMLATWF